MSKEIAILLPKLGESILSATVVQWLKKPGEKIERDEAILEVSTDKVNSEIPSPEAGILKEILVQVDEEVEVEAPLAILILQDSVNEEEEKELVSEIVQEALEENQEMHGFYSPIVIQMAQKEGISFDELKKIRGSGACGRITKKDLVTYLEKGAKKPCPASFEEGKKIKITGLRKTIADAMMHSYREIPHAALVNEIDVTDLMHLMAQEKDAFFKEHGVKLTLTAYVAKAIALALQKYPLLNASIVEDSILVKPSVNLGIAVGVDQGVIVPVIKACEKKTIAQIAKEIALLAEKTRTSKLEHADVTEGTITLTNFGMTGVQCGFPIIRHPEVAIIGIGSIQKRVLVVHDNEMAIRQVINLTLCFDHRVVDGLYSCGFINAVKDYLQVIND